jgi:hypothetical protein
MKNYLFLLILLLPWQLIAQEKPKGLQKITFGTVFLTSGTTSFKSTPKPFTLGYNLSPNLCFVTTSTYHNFLYGFGTNALRAINGYMLTKDIGTYVALSKSLSTRSSYAGLGIEKIVKAENILFFLFTEIGTNIDPQFPIFAIGLHINVQSPIWKRK